METEKLYTTKMNILLLQYSFNLVNALSFDLQENENAHDKCAFPLVEAIEFSAEQFN